jgi:hypothetical protein
MRLHSLTWGDCVFDPWSRVLLTAATGVREV